MIFVFQPSIVMKRKVSCLMIVDLHVHEPVTISKACRPIQQPDVTSRVSQVVNVQLIK